MKFVLLAALAICAGGWLFSKISFFTILAFMKKKGYTPPSDQEVKACTKEAVAYMFRRKS